MAATPLFQSMSAVKAALRLTGTVQPDGLAIIDSAVQEVRVGIYDALGVTRTAEIVALPSNHVPTTEDGVLRLKAELVEQSWVRYLLLRRMPSLVIENTATARQVWNQEGLVRDASGVSEAAMSELWSKIQSDLTDLIDGDPDAGSGVSASVIGPEETNTAPGSKIFL